jgi:hypothetical protein
MTTTTVEASQHESGLHCDESILGATNAMLIVQTPDAYIGDHVPTRAVTWRAAEATGKKWNVSGTHYRLVVEEYRGENESAWTVPDLRRGILDLAEPNSARSGAILAAAADSPAWTPPLIGGARG